MYQSLSTRIPMVVLPATLVVAVSAVGETFQVPGDHSIIQAAIVACDWSGDEIVVGPGIYPEAIDLLGKAIYLRSADGADVTVIDASGLNSSALRCVNGEGPNTIVEGFTITGGTGTDPVGDGHRRGGGMYNELSSPTVTHCVFSSNTAWAGGGMYNHNAASMVTNCTFSANTAHYGAGMYNNSNSSPVLTNCTFSGNAASSIGGGIYNVFAAPAVTNSILWDDTPEEIYNHATAFATVTYSNVQGGYGGAGNIHADPQFVDPGNGDLRLEAGSPCIDAGSSWLAAGFVDWDGQPRGVDDPWSSDTGQAIAGITVDMGAFEFQAFHAADFNQDGVVGAADLAALLGAWGSWP